MGYLGQEAEFELFQGCLSQDGSGGVGVGVRLGQVK